MRSIGLKVVLWGLGTLALSLAAFGIISLWMFSHSVGPTDFLTRTLNLLRDDAVRAYEQGGPEGLSAHLRHLDAYYPAEHVLIDAEGHDLVTGAERPDLASLREPGRRPGPGMEPKKGPRRPRGEPPPGPRSGRFSLVRETPDGRYRFITVVRPPFDPWGFLPYYGAILVVIALMSYALATHLVRPIRELSRTVDRFGQGDLSARAGSARRDEIGELARAFDQMAGRIETLLSAERRLLQDVSHELRSPLARLGFAVALVRSGDDREAAVGRITREVDRLSALVEELMSLTRSEGDANARQAGPVELDELLQELADSTRLEAEAKGCRVVLRVDVATGLTVRGERELIRRAVENVLRNAVRHAPEGTDVGLSLGATDGLARVTVRDRGPGVPEGCLEDIFKPFYRVESDRGRASGGAGLGLSIARRAVELHRGRVQAHNAAPGLRVVIELPAAV